MSAPPWMKYNPAQFVADTTHLSCEERGAYIALINHYWVNGGLPEDDERLARIVGLDAMRWQCVRICISSLFRANWRHKRIDEELAKAAVKSVKAANSARKSWESRGKSYHANAQRRHMRTQSERNAIEIRDNNLLCSTIVGPNQRGSSGMQTISDSVSHLGRFGIVKDKP